MAQEVEMIPFRCGCITILLCSIAGGSGMCCEFLVLMLTKNLSAVSRFRYPE